MNFKKVLCTILATMTLSTMSVSASELDANNYSEQQIISILNDQKPSQEEIDSSRNLKKIQSKNTILPKGQTFEQSEQGEQLIETITPKATWSDRRGNILVSMTAKWSGILTHGHAAIISNTYASVVEALPGVVVEQLATKYWGGVNDEDECYVQGASWANYDNAIAYAKNQLGKSYAIKTPLTDLSQWYCSKLVYKAYESVGINVTRQYMYLGTIKMVTPYDILMDHDLIWIGENTIL